MEKKIILFGLVIAILIFLSGCQQLTGIPTSEHDKFIGTWKSPTETVVFFSDSTFNALMTSGLSMNGNWKTQDQMIILMIWGTDGLISSLVYSYVFSNNSKNLDLVDMNNDVLSFTRQ